jgi:HIRAN domain-containing protein
MSIGVLRQLLTNLLPPPAAQPEPPRPIGPDGSWYLPCDDDDERRFLDTAGRVALRLVPHREIGGGRQLRLQDDATGLLVSLTDPRLPRLGIFVSQLRGEAYRAIACRDGDFRPGQLVRLVREPDNPYDTNAVAVYDRRGNYLAAYVNRRTARRISELLDSGQSVEAISLAGTGPGWPCSQISILTTYPNLMNRLLGTVATN